MCLTAITVLWVVWGWCYTFCHYFQMHYKPVLSHLLPRSISQVNYERLGTKMALFFWETCHFSGLAGWSIKIISRKQFQLHSWISRLPSQGSSTSGTGVVGILSGLGWAVGESCSFRIFSSSEDTVYTHTHTKSKTKHPERRLQLCNANPSSYLI